MKWFWKWTHEWKEGDGGGVAMWSATYHTEAVSRAVTWAMVTILVCTVASFVVMRISYRTLKEAFLESDLVAREPIEQFKHWFEEASNHPHIPEPNAMALATSTM